MPGSEDVRASPLVLFTIAARQEGFCVHGCMNMSIVLTRKKGQANFTNNVLIDPSLVVLQLFLFLCLPTRAANNRK